MRKHVYYQRYKCIFLKDIKNYKAKTKGTAMLLPHGDGDHWYLSVKETESILTHDAKEGIDFKLDVEIITDVTTLAPPEPEKPVKRKRLKGA